MAGPTIDLTSLDRDVRAAASRVERLRGWLRSSSVDDREKAKRFDLWQGTRPTSVRTTYRALVELEPSALDVPLRDALLRWVHELLQERIAEDLVVADADAVHAEADDASARTKRARSAAASAEEGGTRALETPLVTYREAFDAVVHAPDPARARAALDRAGELVWKVGAVRKERRARRFEAARRLDLAHPFALASRGDLGARAARLLDATESLSRSLIKDACKTTSEPWSAASAIQLALGRDAVHGWPSRSAGRWLDDAFRALAPRGIDVGAMPLPIGSASFLRAAETWGYVWRTGGTPRSMPFALARDPYPTPAYRTAFALASVVAEPTFQRRVLELPHRVALGQVRVLRTVMFLRMRALAARTVLSTREEIDPSLFEETTARAFGAPLPNEMREAWPEPRVDEPARFLALLGTHRFVSDLVSRFDEDWFRNPKAGTHLTSLHCGPAFDDDAPDASAEVALARWFEEVLG